MPITDTWLRANNNRERDSVEEKSDGGGLSVRASKKGKLVFQLRYRIKGKPVRLDIGTYPATSLKVARAFREEAKGKLARGTDPKGTKAVMSRKKTEIDTLWDAFCLWYTSECVKEKESAEQLYRSFDLHVKDSLGRYPFEEVGVMDWLNLLDDLKVTTPSIAIRILTNAKQMYRWLMRRELSSSHALLHIRPGEDLKIRKGTRGRSLSEEELVILFKCLNTINIHPTNKLFVRASLMMGSRKGELRTLDPEDIDWEAGIWTLPPEKNKIKRAKLSKNVLPLKRPLLPEVSAIFEEAYRMSSEPTRIFSAARKGGEMHEGTSLTFSIGIIAHAKKRYGYDMGHWSMHDLRKTARTNFSRFTEPHIAEKMLGHTLPGVQGVYDYHDYLEEQRAAYRQWFDYLKSLGA